MANLMATVDELNDAIEILKAECLAHDMCKNCCLGEITGCKLFKKIPGAWETIKEGEQDG